MKDAALPEASRSAGVTRRGAEVFWLVGDRLTNREIADRLRLSERTVESHVSSLLRKLGHPATPPAELLEAVKAADAGPG
ncbi:helix-turn-helix transcriptional regulator [Nonomuraea sp. NPDC048881]|uniref:helix-turn-helix transcriptional regulator n=1 Tax=Nonomuraea sp. NPDC048881 TaxID=3155030 RepID=UPI0033DD849D